MKTFTKWQGNKSKHINKFKEYMPEFTGTYIEPFVGSGALFLHLEPKKWIINDLNKDLINIWNTVKNCPDEITSAFQKFGPTFKPLENQEKINLCRKITYTISDMSFDPNRATTYLLMLYCHYQSSLLKKNKLYFNGLDRNIRNKNKYFFLEDNYTSNLKKVQLFLNNTKGKIYNKSYEQILKKAKEGDFVFLDPPYIEDHNYDFSYNKDERLDNTFLNKLLEEVKKLDEKNVKWLMTQADTQEVKKVFKKYTIHSFPVYRANRKCFIDELVIINY